MISRVINWLKEWNRKRNERYWRMSEADAQSTATALFLELGAVEAGKFMDEWRRCNRQEDL